MAGERSALVDAPENEDIDSSFNKEHVNKNSLCDGEKLMTETRAVIPPGLRMMGQN